MAVRPAPTATATSPAAPALTSLLRRRRGSRPDWSNWAGTQVAHGVTVERPADTAAVAALVQQATEAGRRVRAVGSGHSFSGLARPEEIAVDLGRATGIRHLDPLTGQVRVAAGTTLRQLNHALEQEGRALTNLGDIDAQTVAGAVSTGTHGTGARFGGLAAQVVGLEMVLADGSVIRCSTDEQPDLLAVARVGLGALGVITEVTLATEPSSRCGREEGPMGLDELLERLDELTAGTDHVEAYWWPHTPATSVKRNTRLDGAGQLDRLPRWRELLEDEVVANGLFGAVVGVGRAVPALIPTVNRLAARALGARTFTDVSHRVFTSPRRVRFREMEYAVPRPAAVAAITDVVTAVEHSDLRVAFPVELRVAPADDIPLSTACGRDSAYIAVHVPAGTDHRRYFALVASVLDGYQGRPHWGKVHTLDATRLRDLYPRFDEFVAVRDRLDPTGTFANAELDRVLGSPPGPVSDAPAASRWSPVTGFVLVSAANQALWLSFAPITTGTASRLGVSTSAVGWLSEIFPLLYVLLAVPAGAALDRWFRPSLATGAVLTAAGALLRLGGGFGWLLVGQAVVAVAQPLVLNAVTGTASRYLTPEHRPLGIAVGSAGTFLGFVVAFVLGAALGAGRLPLLLDIGAGFSVAAAVVLAATLRRPPARRQEAHHLSPATVRPEIRRLLADPVLRCLLALVFVGFGVFVALTTWVQSLLAPAGVSAPTTDDLLVAMVVAGVVGSVVIPPVAARRAAQPLALAGAAVASAAAGLALAVVPGVPAGAVALPLIGLLLLPALPMVLELAESLAGPAGGTATALLWLSGNAGGIVIALIVQAAVGSPATAFGLLAATGLLAAPLAWSLRRRLAVPASDTADRSANMLAR